MSEIKTYESGSQFPGDSFFYESDGGDFVRKEHYDKLQSELENSNKFAQEQEDRIKKLQEHWQGALDGETALINTLRMVRESQERQRQLNDAQSLKLESAREVIAMYADVENWFDTGHRIINSDVEIVSGHAKYNGMSFGAGGKRAREWMKNDSAHTK